MAKIEKLPKEIEDRLPVIRDEWIAHGLCTEPSDRPRAERAVDTAYKAANLTPPNIKIWLRSPMEGAIAAAMLANLKEGKELSGPKSGTKSGTKSGPKSGPKSIGLDMASMTQTGCRS